MKNQKSILEISNVINKMTGEGFVLCSSNLQIKKGTLVFNDLFQENVQYAIYGESGYVRKRNNKPTPVKKSYWGYEADNRWWQLNKKYDTHKRTSNGFTYAITNRLLLPDQYEEMANIIIRVAKKSRK